MQVIAARPWMTWELWCVSPTFEATHWAELKRCISNTPDSVSNNALQWGWLFCAAFTKPLFACRQRTQSDFKSIAWIWSDSVLAWTTLVSFTNTLEAVNLSRTTQSCLRQPHHVKATYLALQLFQTVAPEQCVPRNCCFPIQELHWRCPL